MARLIDYHELKQLILAERDKIPHELPSAIYEFGIPKRNHHGDSMRGGIRKALRCLEQCNAVDAVPVVRCEDCQRNNMHGGDCNRIITMYKRDPILELNVAEYIKLDFCSYGERKDDNV